MHNCPPRCTESNILSDSYQARNEIEVHADPIANSSHVLLIKLDILLYCMAGIHPVKFVVAAVISKYS